VPCAPSAPQALSGIAWLANGLGHREKALALLTNAASLDPLSPDVYIVEGAIWVNSADYVRAEAPLRKALTVGPTEPDVHAMGLLERELCERGLRPMALEQLLKYPDAFPYVIASAYAMRGESDKAFYWLDRSYDVRNETFAIVVEKFCAALEPQAVSAEATSETALSTRMRCSREAMCVSLAPQDVHNYQQ